jgi:hypothetical protein
MYCHRYFQVQSHAVTGERQVDAYIPVLAYNSENAKFLHDLHYYKNGLSDFNSLAVVLCISVSIHVFVKM